MTDQLRKMPDHDDGTITVGSLTPGGNRIGPKAWNLIVALSQYDDWFGAVLDVIDEAATPSPDTLHDDAERARIAASLWDRLPHDEASRRIVRDVLGVDPVDDMEAALAARLKEATND